MTQEATPTGADELLSIGQLAERVGINPATLRMWEQRHGFPVPVRLDSGHRRYRDTDTELVRRVARRRDAGERLELAIANVLAQGVPSTPSIYAVLRRTHPHLSVQRLKKSTLLALSWAIEDQYCAEAEPGVVWGAFQTAKNYRSAQRRWDEIARLSQQTTVFGDFDHPDPHGSPAEVTLPDSAPLRHEWAVICDAIGLPVVLTAWELPGQSGVRDFDRVFESMWSIEGSAVAVAARVCADAAGVDTEPLAAPGAVARPAAAEAMMSRMMVYLDRAS